MKKIALALAVILGVIGLQKAWADDPTEALTVTVTVRHVSVAIAPGNIAFGTVDEGSFTINPTAVVVTNTGNVIETFSLAETVSAVDLTKTAVDVPPPDNYALRALFAPNFAVLANGDFIGDDNIPVPPPALATTTIFGRGVLDVDNVKGFSVASSDQRNMFIQFRAGTGNSKNAQQTITVTVTANP